MINNGVLAARVREIAGLGLLSEQEASETAAISLARFPLADAFRLADSIHLNVKVDRVGAEYEAWAKRNDGREENAKPGYVKYAFPDGVHLILSAIPISQEDLLEAGTGDRKPRPFLDHIGVDLRQETESVRALFQAIPFLASQAGWLSLSQGSPGKPVFCCHVQVSAKHWVYPTGSRSIPLEFAYGPLVMNDAQSGCDLRPANPNVHARAMNPSPCCAS